MIVQSISIFIVVWLDYPHPPRFWSSSVVTKELNVNTLSFSMYNFVINNNLPNYFISIETNLFNYLTRGHSTNGFLNLSLLLYPKCWSTS